jgi:hypothetical protein
MSEIDELVSAARHLVGAAEEMAGKISIEERGTVASILATDSYSAASLMLLSIMATKCVHEELIAIRKLLEPKA